MNTAMPAVTLPRQQMTDRSRRHRRSAPLAQPKAQEAISHVVVALENAYGALRNRWPELPAVVITVFYDRHRSVRGYFWDGQWRSTARPALPELHIDSTILSDPPEAILKTLVHEAAHALAKARKVSDTSRDGRYHNQRSLNWPEKWGWKRPRIARSAIARPHCSPAGWLPRMRR